MLIYFLRHGLTDYNAQKRYQGQRDIPLSAQGLAQLRKADIRPKGRLYFYLTAHKTDGGGAVSACKARAGGRPERDVFRQL